MVLIGNDPEERIQILDKIHEDACARVQGLEEARRKILVKLAIAPSAIERHQLSLEDRQLEDRWREAVEHRDEARRNSLDELRQRGQIGQDEYERESNALDRECQRRLQRHGQRNKTHEHSR